ncbi:MAG: hypothetical protein U5K54_09145 [Cytophagales bacterium]|nr:hypothetical protein [Cytophagales bacterium]
MKNLQPSPSNIMNWSLKIILAGLSLFSLGCNQKQSDSKINQSTKNKEVTAKEILGNPMYQAISYEGYRQKTRAEQPTVEQLKEDLRILSAMGIKIVRTYNVQLAHASNLLKAIREIKTANPDFEMYVMLGAWIDCKNAWTNEAPNHDVESEQNEGEIGRAVDFMTMNIRIS